MSMNSDVVDMAHRALSAFGGADLTRDTAAALLSMWIYSGDLTDADRTAVIRRFPAHDSFAEQVERAMRGTR